MSIVIVVLIAIVGLSAFFYNIGQINGRKKCKKEFAETFDWEWVDVE